MNYNERLLSYELFEISTLLYVMSDLTAIIGEACVALETGGYKHGRLWEHLMETNQSVGKLFDGLMQRHEVYNSDDYYLLRIEDETMPAP